MTKPDFRALCAELLQPLSEYDDANPYHEHCALITRARAALAQPEPQGPKSIYRYSPVTIAECGGPCEQGPEYCDCGEIKGEPEPQGPTDDELDELWAEIDGGGAIWAWQYFAHAVLARWGTPAIKPVPVAERPWEREGWCDKYGMCWRFDPCDRGWWSYGPILPSDGNPAPFTYLLPYHALPVPTTH